jgi:hypothetical protein
MGVREMRCKCGGGNGINTWAVWQLLHALGTGFFLGFSCCAAGWCVGNGVCGFVLAIVDGWLHGEGTVRVLWHESHEGVHGIGYGVCMGLFGCSRDWFLFRFPCRAAVRFAGNGVCGFLFFMVDGLLHVVGRVILLWHDTFLVCCS